MKIIVKGMANNTIPLISSLASKSGTPSLRFCGNCCQYQKLPGTSGLAAHIVLSPHFSCSNEISICIVSALHDFPSNIE